MNLHDQTSLDSITFKYLGMYVIDVLLHMFGSMLQGVIRSFSIISVPHGQVEICMILKLLSFPLFSSIQKIIMDQKGCEACFGR